MQFKTSSIAQKLFEVSNTPYYSLLNFGLIIFFIASFLPSSSHWALTALNNCLSVFLVYISIGHILAMVDAIDGINVMVI